MFTLYHFPLDPASRFIRLLMAEYGLEVELITENPWENRKEFLMLNPAGAVPVLVHEGHAICGAFAIAEYIDETVGAKRGTGRLMPKDAAARAEVRRIVEWFLLKFETDAGRIFMTERLLKRFAATAGAPDVSALRSAASNLRYHLLYIGFLLQHQNTLAGDSLTHADFAAAACLSSLDYFGDMAWEADENVKPWYSRMKSRPSFRPLLSERVQQLTPHSGYSDLDF